MSEKKRGRKVLKITQDMIDKAEELAGNGLTNQEVADCLGIGKTTLYERLNECTELADAIRRGKSKGIAMMANNLVTLAKNGNAAANIFFLKARAKWKEGDEDNHDILNKANEALNKMRELADKCLKTPTQN